MLQDLHKCLEINGAGIKEYSAIMNHIYEMIKVIPNGAKDQALDYVIEYLKSQQSPTKM